jgi:dTDP-4-dehydrorhamnose reductase
VTLWILGARGQVGRALARLAASRGVAHVAIGRAEADILDPAALAAAIGRDGVIVNAAAYTAVDRAESEPAQAQAVNAEAVAELARLAATRSLPLIHISTDYVFDGTKPGPYVEDDPVNPVSAYGRSKAAGEAAVRALCPRHVILRTAWVYAAEGTNFVRTMRRLAKERPQLRVVADQHGCPTAADDIAAAILTIAGAVTAPGVDAWGTYHFTAAPPTTWHGFARAILADRPDVTVTPIATADYPTAARRPGNSVLDCGRIRARFGIAQPDWRQSLARVLDEMRQQEASP